MVMVETYMKEANPLVLGRKGGVPGSNKEAFVTEDREAMQRNIFFVTASLLAY